MNEAGDTSTRVPIERFLNLGEARPRREEDGLGWEATRRKLELAVGVLLLVCLRRVVVEPWGARIVVVPGFNEVESILISCHPFRDFYTAVRTCRGFVRRQETNLYQMEWQSIEKLVRKNHGVLLISGGNGIQVIVPLDTPAKLLSEGFQGLFLYGP